MCNAKHYKALQGSVKQYKAMTFDPFFMGSGPSAESTRKAAGLLNGKHYTKYVDKVKALKRSGKLDAAAELLLQIIDAVDREALASDVDWPIAPWYFEQLAIIYRKTKDYKSEAAILQRYVLLHQGKRDRPYGELLERLTKARSLEAAAAATPDPEGFFPDRVNNVFKKSPNK